MNDLTSKNNEELLQILKEGTNLHSERTIIDVEIILQERDVQYNVPYKKVKVKTGSSTEIKSEVSKRLTEYGFVFAPILVAAIFLASPFLLEYFVTIPRGANPEHLFYLSIGVLIFKRIVVLGTIDHYNKKFLIVGMLWYVLGLIFGSWALIAYNIYLWVQTAPKMDNQPLDSSID
jgi:hypothetical protein